MFDALLAIMIKNKTYFNWSSGKDASMALYFLQKEGTFKISKLITTVNSHYNRVSMHGLRTELLQRQAQEVGIPLSTIALPEQPSMEDYSAIMTENILKLKSEGFTHCGFGDIFLEDLRTYRENQLKPFGITSVFPLWKKDTTQLIHEFIAQGFKAVVVCTKSELLDESFVGRELDESFINDLPKGVDPCGENGEFHTFCYDGPIFKNPVEFEKGENIFREYKNPSKDKKELKKEKIGFWFIDLIPK